MDLLKKTTPWVVASLLAATSAFGQNNKCPPPQKSFEQGHELVQTQMMAAYNAPARIDVRGAWDFYASGSFTYMQARQENMELGIASDIAPANMPTLGVVGNWINMDFDYKPGFKVGLGMNFDHDNWDAFAEYTWFRGHNHKSSNGPTNGTIIPAFGHPNVMETGPSFFYNTGKESWNLHMDFVDLELARSYYVGTRLSFRPFFGARGGWIRQRLHTRYENTTLTTTLSAPIANTPVLGTLDTVQKTHSWGVGPRAGIYTNWMLGQGFRLFGDGFADILYTRYKIHYHEVFTRTAAGTTFPFITHQSDSDHLRTHLDLELGIGWGSYFDNNNWHVDLAAAYGFQVFFDQNMFRHYEDDVSMATSSSPHGNLYVHGLTASIRFDF